jgi:hypothetical protein
MKNAKKYITGINGQLQTAVETYFATGQFPDHRQLLD